MYFMLLPYFATKLYLLVKKETKKKLKNLHFYLMYKILTKCLMVANNSIPKELIKKILAHSASSGSLSIRLNQSLY